MLLLKNVREMQQRVRLTVFGIVRAFLSFHCISSMPANSTREFFATAIFLFLIFTQLAQRPEVNMSDNV